MKKIPLRAIIAAIISAVVIIAVITAYIMRIFFFDIDYSLYKKLRFTEKLVDKNYYFDYSMSDVADGVISGYIDGLGDNYAEYNSSANAGKELEKLKGNGKSTGIMSVFVEHKYIYVWRVYSGSPADLAGIRQGDKIISVDDMSVKYCDYDDISEALENSKGKIPFEVQRGNKNFTVNIKPEVCETQSVFYGENNGMGYIEVVTFNAKTYLQFKAAVEYLMSRDVKGIAIDLRHNGGGTVSSCAKMLDYLLPEGDIIRVRYKDKKIKTRNYSDKNFVDLPFAVLVDEETASSSEIFASTMRDFGAAVLIGKTTYGKSIIQRNYELNDGSVIKFTVGEFVPKNGKSYQNVGLEPDIKINDPECEGNKFYLKTTENDKALAAAYEYLSQNQLS